MVRRNTDYRWSNDPEIRRMVLTFRRFLNRAVGRMARRATKAAEVIVQAAKNAELESVKLAGGSDVAADRTNSSRLRACRASVPEAQNPGWKRRFF